MHTDRGTTECGRGCRSICCSARCSEARRILRSQWATTDPTNVPGSAATCTTGEALGPPAEACAASLTACVADLREAGFGANAIQPKPGAATADRAMKIADPTRARDTSPGR